MKSPHSMLSQVAPADASPLVNPGQTFGGFFREERGEERGVDEGWEDLLTGQCEEGQAYCWMGCLSLPPDCTEDQAICVNDLAETCCTETVTEDCLDMDGSCQWQCA